jgi:hypothetical protein
VHTHCLGGAGLLHFQKGPGRAVARPGAVLTLSVAFITPSLLPVDVEEGILSNSVRGVLCVPVQPSGRQADMGRTTEILVVSDALLTKAGLSPPQEGLQPGP